MNDRERRNLEHAEWRVQHAASLLQCHRDLRAGTATWKQREADYMKILEEARETLRGLRDHKS
ncbi:hypothetical protein AYO49_05955 [Verrucomicrobiaceae bacterium SCGC AG-212-N21]|nr:hypothetical protein AYO49_05955 [Verrucomicrobiaceae bacterium SCGC AG-212-N21]